MSGVVETFYLLFKSDADKAAEGLEKVEDAADGAERSLNKADRATRSTAASTQRAARSTQGLKSGMASAAVGANATAAATGKVAAATAAADLNAERLSASFLKMARTAAGPLLAVFSVAGLTKLATGRAEVIRELDQYSAKLNSTIGDVDAFQRSVQELGGEGAKALDSLVKIGEKVNEAFSDKDSGARKDFQEWGLAFKDSEGQALGATEAMLGLAASLETVSRAEGLARIKKLGIEDAATIELLLKGRQEVERYINVQKQMGVVTEEQAEITREYYAAMGQLGNRLTSVGNNILATFLPGITGVVQAFSGLVDWITQNQTLVEGFFIGVAGVLTIRFLPAMAKVAAATLAATWPWLLLALAIAGVGVAVALAYEDFKAWQEGAPSILGNLLGDFEAFVEKWQWLIDGMSWDWDAPVIEFDIERLKANIEIAKGALSAFGTWIKDTLGGAVQWVIDLIAGIPGAVRAAVVSLPLVSGAVDVVQGDGTGPAPLAGTSKPAMSYGTTFGGSVIMPSSVSAGQSALGAASSAPQELVSNTTNRTTTVTTGDIIVNTQATDAAGVAREVQGALRRELQNTAAGFDDGVDR